MLTNQDMVRLIAAATSDNDDNYKSMQELLAIIASCVEVDETDNKVYLRVKTVEDA